jgi:UDP-N-acetylmuramoyl-tripeptide--D-alanyl-D-alanine ligase
MGMSNFGEIDQLAKIAQPDFGIITNIGDSHLEFLKNRENVFKAKTELFKYISSENQIVYGEDPFLKKLKATKIILENFSDGLDGASFRIFGEEYKIKLNGEYNAINAAMAVVIGKRFGLTPQEIKKGLNEAIITHMRFEKIDRENRLFINDAYNASPISMKKSLKTFSEVYKNNKNIAVLGDMLELGENEIDFHKNVLLEALKLNIEKIYLYGPRMKKAADLIQNDKLKCFENKEEIKSLLLEEKEKVNIFLKGSRGMRIEEVIA